MALLAFQLAGLHAVGSLADGAKLAGASSLAAGLVGPWRGSWLDRREMRRGLQLSCYAAGLLMLAFTVAVAARAGFAVLLVLAVLLGVAVGGIWGGFRALLLPTVPKRLLRQAHFTESLSIELGYGLGPLLVTGIALVFGIVAALSVMTVVFFAAAVALSRVAELPPTVTARVRRPPLSRPVWTICGIGALLSLGFGLVEGNVPARMAEYGLDADASGVFLVFLAIGSIVGGAAVSLRPIHSARPMRVAGALFMLFAVLIVPSALVSEAWLFAGCLLVVSLMLVPLNGLGAAEIEARLTTDGRGRVFAMYLAAMQVGGGAGVALNGLLMSYIPAQRVPLVSSAVYGVIGVVLLTASVWQRRRRTPLVVSGDAEGVAATAS